MDGNYVRNTEKIYPFYKSKCDSDFPYLVLNVLNHQSFPINPGFQVMHWHEDLQFIYVVAGDIEIKTLDSDILLNTNSGLFINKNVVHLVKNNNNCHYKSIIFPGLFSRILWKNQTRFCGEYR